MFNACKPGCRVSSAHHEQMLMAMLKHVGLHKLHIKFPDIWTAVREDCDRFLSSAWCSHAARDTDRGTWITAHRHALSSVLDITLVNAVMSKDPSVQTTEALRPLFSTMVGSNIFRREALDLQFDEYKATIRKQLHESEMQNFTEPVVEGFKMRMMQSCRVLVEAGHHAWSKKDHYNVQFMMQQTPLEMASLNDHWSYALEARLRTLAVHTNKVERLPWEKVLFGAEDPLPALPEHVAIDLSLLQDMANTRKAVNATFAKFPGAQTFQSMRKIVHTQLGHLKDYDKHFRLEISFLDNVAEAVAEKQVRQSICNLFPDGTNAKDPRSPSTVLEGVHSIQAGALHAACQVTLAEDVEGVEKLVANIAEGARPFDAAPLPPPPPPPAAGFTDGWQGAKGPSSSAAGFADQPRARGWGSSWVSGFSDRPTTVPSGGASAAGLSDS